MDARRGHSGRKTRADAGVSYFLAVLYVDDLASGPDNTESALELAKKIKTRLAEAGFNMRKWLSNSKELMTEFESDPQFSESPRQSSSWITAEDQGYSKSTFILQQLDSHPRVLGQGWNPQTDTLIMIFSAALKNVETNAVTKRSILSIAAKFYDPLGLISPVTLRFKQMFHVKFVRSRQPGIISLMSYSLLWFVKINTELLRGVFTTQRFDTPV